MVSPEQGELKELIVRAEEDDTGWEERTPGAFMKMIWEDPETGASFALFNPRSLIRKGVLNLAEWPSYHQLDSI